MNVTYTLKWKVYAYTKFPQITIHTELNRKVNSNNFNNLITRGYIYGNSFKYYLRIEIEKITKNKIKITKTSNII